MVRKISIAVTFLALSGCATNTASSERVAATSSTTDAPIRAAEELGANKIPEAALELQLAKDETEQAKQFMKNGKKERSQMMLARAQADAELAVALARQAPIQAEAEKAVEQVKTLQQTPVSQ